MRVAIFIFFISTLYACGATDIRHEYYYDFNYGASRFGAQSAELEGGPYEGGELRARVNGRFYKTGSELIGKVENYTVHVMVFLNNEIDNCEVTLDAQYEQIIDGVNVKTDLKAQNFVPTKRPTHPNTHYHDVFYGPLSPEYKPMTLLVQLTYASGCANHGKIEEKKMTFNGRLVDQVVDRGHAGILEAILR